MLTSFANHTLELIQLRQLNLQPYLVPCQNLGQLINHIIVKYIWGFTSSAINTELPIIIEGIVLGLIGSFLAISILLFGYNYFSDFLSGRYIALLSGISGYIIGVKMILNDLIIIFLTIGVGIGILGSLISLKKFLSV